ncbi:L-fucose isomerase [Escherichia coli]|uniref:L-fucose isomerase n=1 Tax=Escherichia coli TaxID=562 RepID=A0A377CXM2_ECOLX|nr:L-fucose isomerase [Escherichia coli]
MMQGNSKLADIGRVEESLGYNAIAAGFQGQRHWTDQYPNGDTAEAILNSSFDWNGVREPFVVATENDSLNGVANANGSPAHRHRSGICRCAYLLVTRSN